MALVHRPRYDDWTLPKGKLKRGEDAIVAACREVWEETGVRVRVGTRLPTVGYQTPVGSRLVDKTVDYWAMAVSLDGDFRAGAETDRLAWLSVPASLRLLTYPRDIIVLSAFAALPALRPPVVLLRPGADPATLVARLRCFAPQRLVCAPGSAFRRTLEPLATELRQEVDVAAALHGPVPAALLAIRALATAPTVVCAPAAVLSGVLHELTGEAHPTRGRAGWVLSLPVRSTAKATVDAIT